MLVEVFFVLMIIFIFSANPEGVEMFDGPRLIYDRIDPNYESIWEATQCLQRFLTRFLRRVEEMPFYLATKNVTTLKTDLILQTVLGGEISTYLLSGNVSYGATYSSNDKAIILSDNLDALMQDSQPSLTLLCSGQCVSYFVILTDEYKSEQEFTTDIGKLVQFLWKKKIGNVAVAAIVKETFVFGKSQNFKYRESCKPEDPKVVGICSDNHIENVKLSSVLFADIKANNCSMKTTYISRPPYTIAGKMGTISGVEGELINTMSLSIPFRFKSGVVFKVDYASLYTLPKKILAENSNMFLVFGGMPSLFQDGVDFTVSYDVTQLVWVLPLQSRVSLLALTNPLKLKVWITLISLMVTCIVGGPVLFQKFDGLLEMSGLLLGISLPQVPSSFAHKIFFITWSMMGFVLAQFYLASLAKNLLLGSTARISNVAELLNSELKLVTDSELNWAYADNGVESEYKYDKTVRKRLVYMNKTEIERTQDDLMTGKLKDTAILVALNFSSAKFDLGDYAYQLPEVVKSYPIALATWKGMPFLEEMNGAIMALVETGHVIHWANIFSKMSKGYKRSDEEKNVGLNELFPAFILLLSGYACSVSVLWVEILYNKLGAKKFVLLKKMSKKR